MATRRDGVNGDLDWLLDQFVERATGTTAAAVLSSDGLLVGKSGGLSDDEGDHLSAVASAFQSLAHGAGRHFRAGPVEQTVVQLERAYLLVTSAGGGACLAVLAERSADIGLVAYEMNVFVGQVGGVLEPAPRAARPS